MVVYITYINDIKKIKETKTSQTHVFNSTFYFLLNKKLKIYYK